MVVGENESVSSPPPPPTSMGPRLNETGYSKIGTDRPTHQKERSGSQVTADEGPFPTIVDAPNRKSHSPMRGLLPRRYPLLRRYCGILSGLSLVHGGLIILVGLGLGVSPFFGVAIPQLGSSSALLFVLIGVVVCMVGYTTIVCGLAGVEFIRTVLDIEENTRKIWDQREPPPQEE